MRLPEVIKPLNYNEILNEQINIVASIIPNYKPAESDDFMLVLRALAYRELHLRAYFNELAGAFFLSTAKKSNLDNLAETLYGLYRLPGSCPYAEMEFSLTTKLNYDVLIPKNFELVDETGKHFAKLLDDVVIKAEEIKQNGKIELQEEVANSKVKTTIQVSPLPYLKIKQLSEFINGSNPESDEEFKARIRISLSDKSTAGSGLTYKSFTLKSDERIEDVKVLSPSAGIVDVVYYSKNADEIMQKRVEKTLNRDDIRPLTDKVQVKKAKEIKFDVEGKITIKVGADSGKVYINSLENLKTLKFKIGEDVSLAKIVSLLMVENVVDVELTAPTQNIKIDDYSVAVLNEMNISYKVSNEL